MELLRDVSTCAASTGVFTQPRPQADMSRVKIPQCGGLPPRRDVLSFRSSTGGVDNARLDSERFETVHEMIEENRPQCPHRFGWGHFRSGLIQRPTTASGTTLFAAATLACARAASRLRSAALV